MAWMAHQCRLNATSTHCHHRCVASPSRLQSQDIVKCKSQLLDNGDSAGLFHGSFILRVGGGGGGGAGFAGEITESQWIIQYSHRSECVVCPAMNKKGASMEKKRRCLKIPAGKRRFFPSPLRHARRCPTSSACALFRSHVSW